LKVLARYPRHRLRFAHLCDAPVAPRYSTEKLLHEGRAERLPPGEGDIGLKAFMSALPCPRRPVGGGHSNGFRQSMRPYVSALAV